MTGERRGRGGRGRGLKQKVTSTKKRSASSVRWLERHLNEPYVHQARAAGYRSRAAFKLLEVDDKYQILKPGNRVVDLGAAPGGWSQIAAERVRSDTNHPLVVAIDFLDMDPIAGVAFIKKDFLDDDAPDLLIEALGGDKADLVMSDMAAPTTGHRKTDHLRTTHLFEVAADFARDVLKPGGAFLAKVFRGGTEQTLLAELKRDYARVVHIKPQASRAESVELYVLALGFRGR